MTRDEAREAEFRKAMRSANRMEAAGLFLLWLGGVIVAVSVAALFR